MEEYYELEDHLEDGFAAKLWKALEFLGYVKRPHYNGYKKLHIGHYLSKVEVIVYAPRPSDGAHRIEKIHYVVSKWTSPQDRVEDAAFQALTSILHKHRSKMEDTNASHYPR